MAKLPGLFRLMVHHVKLFINPNLKKNINEVHYILCKKENNAYLTCTLTRFYFAATNDGNSIANVYPPSFLHLPT